MEQMYQEYKGLAEFFIVYISEAHAADDSRPVDYATKLGIKEHKNYGERCTVASRLLKEKKLSIPCLIDGMDNDVATAYKGWPDRVYLIRKDGKLAVAGKRGPWGFRPGVSSAKTWLAKYKETGREPGIVLQDDNEIDIGALNRAFAHAFREPDYKKALEIGEKLHKARPNRMGTIYNIACVHCLSGDKANAYIWLEKAVDAGYRDADHLGSDDDFKSIRDEERFQKIVERVRKQADRGSAAVPVDRAAVAAILGDWDMKTTMGEHSMDATMSISLDEGKLVGTWTSRGGEMVMSELKYKDDILSFKRSIGEGMDLTFEGKVQGDGITGTYAGPFGALECDGTRKKP